MKISGVPRMQAVAPAQTLTFLFTDIEGSTRMWERDAASMREALERHDRLVRGAIESHAGYVFKTVGDAFYATFSNAVDAALAAADVQRAIGSQSWDVGEFRVRAAIHTGSVQMRDGDYFGPPLNQISRILSLVHGGQVLISDATERLLRDGLSDGLGLRPLGERALRDVNAPRNLFQLTFPGMLEVFSAATDTTFVPTNLPQELSSFVGRKFELGRIRKLLRSRRMITIVGPGGVGKTRLAQHVAREELESFSGGVWFCELAQVHEATQIEPAVANTLRLNVAQQDPFSVIAQSLGARKTLVVLDNSERIVRDVAIFARRLIEACPAVTILTTSREALRVLGEQTILLQPLSVPQGQMTIAEFKKCESVRLILERAKLVNERFTLNERNAPAIARICERLDGIPLALELAAAQLSTLSPQQIADRLTQRFALLGSSEAALDHHRTLRGTIDWSYDMLDDAERVLFARLAVFVGSFSLEAVEAICGEPPLEQGSLVQMVTRLAQKSLLTPVQHEDTIRYRYLETVHSYALERLEALPDEIAVAQRHFQYWTNAIAEIDAAENHEYDELERSHSDIHSALEWGLRERPLEMADNVRGLSRFWRMRGYLGEGATFAEQVANVEAIELPKRAQLLVTAAHMRNSIGDHEAAENDAQNARVLFESGSDPGAAADALAALAGVRANAGAYEPAETLYLEALEGFKTRNNGTAVVQVLANLGIIRTALERFDDARAALQEGLERANATNDPISVAWLHGALGNLEQQQGNFNEATASYQRALAICRASSSKIGIATVLNHLAEVALARDDRAAAIRYVEESLSIGAEHDLLLQLSDALEVCARLNVGRDDETAARLFGAVDALRERARFPFTGPEWRVREAFFLQLQDLHGEEWLAKHSQLGKSLQLAESIRLARASLKR